MPTAREIGALVVDMRADSTKFVRGMDESARSLRKTEEATTRTTRRFSALGSAATKAGVIIGVIVAAGTAAAAVVNRYGEAARDILNVSDSLGVSVGNVQALEKIYRQFGLELVDVRTNLTDVAEALGDARQGAQDLQQVFSRANIDYTQPSQNLLDVITRLGPALDDVSGRRIFGEDFDRLRPFLSNPTQFIRAAQSLNSLTRNQLLNLQSQYLGLNRLIATADTAAASASAAQATFFNRVSGRPVPDFGSGRTEVPIAAPELTPSNTRVLEFQRQITDGIIASNREAELLNATYGRQAEEVARITAEFAIQDAHLAATNRVQRELEDERNAPSPDSTRVMQLTEERAALESILPLLDSYVVQTGVAAAATARITEEQRILSEIAEGVGTAFSSFAGSAISDFDSIGDAAKRLLSDLIQLAIQFAIIEPLKRGLESGSFSGAGGIFSLFGAQHGGRQQGLGIVGEGGAELVDFSTPGRVYTNEQLASALGQGGSNGLVVNISGVQDPSGVRAIVYEVAPELERGIRAGMAEDAGRPSLLRDKIRGRA